MDIFNVPSRFKPIVSWATQAQVACAGFAYVKLTMLCIQKALLSALLNTYVLMYGIILPLIGPLIRSPTERALASLRLLL